MNGLDRLNPHDIAGWRARLAAAGADRAALQAAVREWATALGCTFGTAEGETHILMPPDDIDPRSAVALHGWSVVAGLHLRPPLGSWAASDARLDPLPEWVTP